MFLLVNEDVELRVKMFLGSNIKEMISDHISAIFNCVIGFHRNLVRLTLTHPVYPSAVIAVARV